ncbi:TPA: hypothetical protein ACRTM5_004480, partial [Aeromonas hydrophila]
PPELIAFASMTSVCLLTTNDKTTPIGPNNDPIMNHPRPLRPLLLAATAEMIPHKNQNKTIPSDIITSLIFYR